MKNQQYKTKDLDSLGSNALYGSIPIFAERPIFAQAPNIYRAPEPILRHPLEVDTRFDINPYLKQGTLDYLLNRGKNINDDQNSQ